MSNPFQIIISAITVSQAQGYSKAAALTFLLCDISYTFSDETKFMWRSRLSLSKILYFIARYFGVVLILCREFIRLMTLLGTQLYLILVDVICIMRLFALYDRDMRVFALMMFHHRRYEPNYFEVGAGYYAVYRVTSFHGAMDPPRSELSDRYGCGFLLSPVTDDMLKIYTVKMSLSAANAVLFLVLSLYKLRSQMRLRQVGNENRSIWMGRFGMSPLVIAFVRDVIEAISAALTLYRGGFYFTPLWPWIFVVFSYTGCRLILNIRRAGNEIIQGTEDITVPPLQFAKTEKSEGEVTDAIMMSEIRSEHV
ncbi:hypothetical protein DFP72DRAFT_923989 [Ephemerocybe angulata]|uniref:DUF6533 domain-containing protein n=1 Tax=Ephemerocybe angulata TaxID=980116 RepID=A0A8H6HFS8_9AGAR|nr:hypothetical protein DFP72DRAFT_923989 [Tulosesus angulatus]